MQTFLLKDNRRCDNSSLCNMTFDSTLDLVYANISSFSNFSTVEDTPPSITLTSPANASTETSDSTPDFTFNAVDTLNTTLSCTLWINDSSVTKNASRYGTNSAVQNASATTFTANASLSNSGYL